MTTWTPDRPTKPGKYELSLHPDARAGLPVQMTAEVAAMPDWLRCDETDAGLIVRGDVDAGTWLIELSSSRLDRALWRPYVEPADPHVRYQQEEERDELLRKPRLSRTDQARLQELNDALRTESPEERKYLDILRRAAAHRESLRSRIEALPDLVLGSGRVIGGAVDRGAVLALLDEVTR